MVMVFLLQRFLKEHYIDDLFKNKPKDSHEIIQYYTKFQNYINVEGTYIITVIEW